MQVIKYKEYGEFWGAKYCEDRVELEIEPEEVKDIILERIDCGELDSIPKILDIYLDDYHFELNPYDYLSDNDVKDIEAYLEKGI